MDNINNKNLKKKTFTGIIWKFLERSCAQGISLIVTIVIARLLDPSDYAPISIVAIFFTFANLFVSSGLNTALMQKKNVEKDDYSTVFTFTLIISIIIYFILFFTAPLIAKLYNQQILIPVFRVMSIVLIINAVQSVLCAYISSNLQFRKFFFATIVGTLISAFVGIALAYNGFGVWALVAQQLTNSVIDTLMLFITTKVRFSLKFSSNRLKALYKFGSKMFIASFITTLYDEFSPLVIGIKFSGSDLALYEKGKSFPSLINSAFNDSVSAVVFPAMSKVQDDKETILAFTRRFIGISSFLVFPAMIGFFCVAEQFTLLILSEKWAGAIIYIKIFCVCYLFNIIQNGNLQAIKAIGRSDIVLKMEILKKSLYFVILIAVIFIAKSPIYLAGVSVVNTVIATIINTYPNRKLIGYSYKMQLLDLLPNLFLAISMGVVVYAFGKFCFLQGVANFALQIVVGIVCYAGIALLTKNKNMMYTIDLLKGLFK